MPVTGLIDTGLTRKAYQDASAWDEQNLASRLANQQTQNDQDANAAAQQAIRGAYLAATPQQAGTPPDALQNAQAQQTVQSAAALPPPAQSPAPVQMSGTAIPAPPTPAQIPNAPQGQHIPQVPASALARPGSAQPNGLTSQAPQTRNPAWVSPFHSQQFQQAYEQNLMNNPNAGSAIQKMKADADAVTAKVMEMAAMGNVDEAKFVALRNGMEIPDNVLQNADLTKAVTFAQKAYPNEADKGQVFYQAYMQNPGDTMSKVQAGIQAAGRPENTAQRELNKALALSAFNEQNIRTRPTILNVTGADGRPGLASVTPNGTSQPVIGPDGQPVGVGTGTRGSGIGGGGVNERNIQAAMQEKNMTRTQAIQYLANMRGNSNATQLHEEQFFQKQAESDPNYLKDPTGTVAKYRAQYQSVTGRGGAQTPAVAAPPPQSSPGVLDRVNQWLGRSSAAPTNAPAAPAAPSSAAPIPGTPAQSPIGGQSIRVKNPTTGEAFDIQPADLPNAMQEGFQIEQQ